jgi:ribosome maturation protein Sdo1
MKKRLLLKIIPILLLVGCMMSNTPTSKVEDLFTKYQTMDTDISAGINVVLDEQNLSLSQKDRYRDILEKQYKNLVYQIKEETIDGNKATVITEIEVLDLKKSLDDLTFDSSIYTKETYDEEKLNRLEKAKDKVKYTLEITLTKNDKDEWQLDALTNEQMKKIQGMY